MKENSTKKTVFVCTFTSVSTPFLCNITELLTNSLKATLLISKRKVKLTGWFSKKSFNFIEHKPKAEKAQNLYLTLNTQSLVVLFLQAVVYCCHATNT